MYSSTVSDFSMISGMIFRRSSDCRKFSFLLWLSHNLNKILKYWIDIEYNMKVNILIQIFIKN
jgi:hypothetical protein